MSEHRLKLEGITCDSCEKLIGRAVAEGGGSVREINPKSGEAVIECPEEKIGDIRSALAAKGFPEKGESGRGDPARVGEYMLFVLSGKHEADSRLLNYSIGSLAALALAGSAALYFSPVDARLVPLLVLAALGAVMIAFAYHRMACHRKEISCMNGMMAGMTLGMMAGFMSGALLGATNGMFIGSVGGMAVGIALGLEIGRFCGIMGAMEGIMAGLMAGIMGAMTSVMMLNDNLVAFLYLVFGVCAVIVAGLSYMMHRESSPVEAPQVGFAGFFSSAAVLCALMILTMVMGPKGPLIYP